MPRDGAVLDAVAGLAAGAITEQLAGASISVELESSE